ncbi:neurofilament medium polypeptide-like [Solanum pennellii]|uniref:Neurofilament medium polypeptide-like n=1 Tax=Solanum pennellii TaxID=28526 RepID=A0ABM1HSM9_SOLPN|nr:neurofilament medium polypeptide-like [Solanum pennellii]
MANPLVAYSDDESSSDSAYSQGEKNPVVDVVPNLGEESQLPTKPPTSSSKSDLPPSPPPKATSPPPQVTSSPSPVKEASLPVVTDSPPPPIIESPPSPIQETPLSPVQETPLSPTPKSPTTTVPHNPPPTPSHQTTPQNPPPSPTHDDILLRSLHPKKPRRPRKHIAVKQVRPHRPVTRSAHVVKPTYDATSGVKRRRLGKSLVRSSVSPMNLDSETDDVSEGKHSTTPQSKSKSAKRNADKFLKVGRKKYFQTKSVLRGRTFHPDILSMDIVKQVCELLRFQGWEELFLEPSLIYEKEVVDFYTNLIILEGDVVSSSVKGVDIVFDATKLGEILHIPSVGINEYNWGFDEYSSLPAKFSQGRVNSRAQTVLKGIMRSLHKLLFEIVHKVILPRGHQRHIASIRDIGLINAIECKERIDWPTLIIQHLARIVDPKLGSHQLAFGNLLTRVFDAFEVPLGERRI